MHADDHTGKKQLPWEAGSMPFSNAGKHMTVVLNLDARSMLEDQQSQSRQNQSAGHCLYILSQRMHQSLVKTWSACYVQSVFPDMISCTYIFGDVTPNTLSKI